MASVTSSPLAHFSFPRTGKRGVPQQFPRRLYEMLDGETRNAELDSQYPKIISWSSSGKAFRIYHVGEFSSTVLPKYFRTKKFSSFQRNLNLYGFTKVRKGSDTDMYAHPSFVRDDPEALLKLHKINKARRNSIPETFRDKGPRSVSPTHTTSLESAERTLSPVMPSKKLQISKNIVFPDGMKSWSTNGMTKNLATPVSPSSQCPLATSSDCDASSTGSNDRGKLDLLAFALEQEFACYR